MRCFRTLLSALALLLMMLPLTAAEPQGAEVKLLLPLQRKAYQTNEWIDLSVVRSSAAALPASNLALNLQGEDGSKLTFSFPLPAVDAEGKGARRTEHLHLNGRLLRPGNYSVEVAANGATDKADIEIHSHIRKSSFKLGDWASGAKGPEQATLGEDSLGFNLLYAAYGGLSPDDSIRGGLDYMWCCTMSGAHQMDLRMECDWSDPYVLAGGTARVVRRAFQDRINPNAVGVHYYDEPGLTWHKHPKTGEMTPHNIPAQDRAFRGAFGKDPLQYHEFKADNAEHLARWNHWGLWKLAFMEAAWKNAAYGVSTVRPDFISATQSVYGWNAYADGYYFNIARSLPVMSGHGGYDDASSGYFFPGFTFEFGRMRDLQKPNWYLPAWDGNMPSNRFRLEQYLAFMNNLQGMFKPPDMHIHRPSKTAATANGIVESNKLMARLGTVFTTMPVTRPDVAVLYSMSHNLAAQTKDMNDNYDGDGHGRQRLLVAHLAGLLIQMPAFPIVEEDVTDGTLAAHHKALFLPGVNALNPKVIQALEAYIVQGGAVIVSDDCKVQIKGATKLGCPIDVSLFQKFTQLWKEQKMDELYKIHHVGNIIKEAEPVAKALKAHYQKLGIKPALASNVPGVITSRQALGDVEYLFAVNASYDNERGGQNAIKPTAARLSLAADGRPVYDAVNGHAAPFLADAHPDKVLSGDFRFGPGQMRVFARTARPIGGVQVLTPTVFRDYTVAQDPLHVEFSALVTDNKGRVLSGAIPLQIQLIDPLGVTRYDLYRATDKGICKVKLPLAVNDPAGSWKVVVKELLDNSEETATFKLTNPAQCAAIAGATPRAISFSNERENVFRFFRTYKDVTIATGKSEYHQAAAERLTKTLASWDVRCKIVKAADVKAREINEDEAFAWCGLEPGRVRPKLPQELETQLKAGADAFLKQYDKNGDGVLTKEECPPFLAKWFERFDSNGDKKLDKGEITNLAQPNSPSQVGFDVRGAVILLGTPEDNPLIAFVQNAKFLPYKPGADFPGRGRGLIAWQRDAIGYGQESLTLIAHDEKGLAEAVGTVYEAASGLDPLTQWELPANSSITAASTAPAKLPEATIAWKMALPDRAAALRSLPGGGLVVLTQDGSLTALDAAGKVQWQKTVSGGEAWALDLAASGDLIVVGASHHIVGFDSKGKQLFDVPLPEEKPVSVLTFLTVSLDGTRIAAGTSNGKLTLFGVDGKPTWTVGGVDPADKKAKPNPYLSGAFTADGKSLIALTDKEAHVIATVDGKVATKTPGINGSLAPQRSGDQFLVSDGRSVAWFAPADGKMAKKASGPDTGVVGMALVGEDVIIGTEADGAIRKLPASSDPAQVKPTWEHKVAHRLVKRIAQHNGHTAVAYWGGLVQVLDGTGAVKAAHVFPQDVAALLWNGKNVVVALADGQVIGLATK